MQIAELDPLKRYLISFPDPDHVMTQEDVNGLRARIKENCADAVVVVGADINPTARYWGLYCEQCGTWWVAPDYGRLVFYPAPEIANAHLQDRGWIRNGPVHLWKVQEFGKEEYVAPENLKPRVERCPVLTELNQLSMRGTEH